ncbi:MAG: hypothetical protein Q9227_008424 [Pyrenula ochraceoflavens]
MVRLSLAALPLLTTLALAASDVLDLIPSNFDDVVLKSGKPALVEFFAPWCGHCKNLAPIYEELATSFAHASNKVSIAKVDADEHKSLGKQYGVQGFPTVKWFSGKKGDAPEDYNGARDLESLSAFITEKTGVKSKLKKEQSSVQMLTDATFSNKIGKDQDVLVAFTAPWCGHCKALAPTWEKVASDFSSEANVVIAKVDAESPASKSTAESHGVSSYPTIKFFPRGSTTPLEYDGGRSEDDLISYLNEKAGTHRVAGGGLSAVAGTIKSLDDLVEKYVSDPSEKAGEEIRNAATALKDKSAEYYVKVLEKIGKKPEYAMTERERLQKMLGKGGLAREKIDDLTRRSNVLNKFMGGEKKTEL